MPIQLKEILEMGGLYGWLGGPTISLGVPGISLSEIHGSANDFPQI